MGTHRWISLSKYGIPLSAVLRIFSVHSKLSTPPISINASLVLCLKRADPVHPASVPLSSSRHGALSLLSPLHPPPHPQNPQTSWPPLQIPPQPPPPPAPDPHPLSPFRLFHSHLRPYLRSYWTSIISIVESELDAALTVHYPENMYGAMRYSVFCGGAKRAPSIMCIAACELFRTPRTAALPTAAALEMVHAAFHMHDDLPCMAAAPLHHGRPSTHAQYGVGVALLSGDALFALGFAHFATKTPPDFVPREALVSVLNEIARTVRCTGMAAGQLLDLTGVAASGEVQVLPVLEKNFGEFAECSAVCGGILAGTGEDDQVALRQYGRTVGVLYELVDDVLMESNGWAAKMGSNVSVVRALGMERALELVEQLRDKALNELLRFGHRYGDRVLPLYSFVDYAVERGFVLESGEEAVAVAGVASPAASS